MESIVEQWNHAKKILFCENLWFSLMKNPNWTQRICLSGIQTCVSFIKTTKKDEQNH
jgi:hypothetical protein